MYPRTALGSVSQAKSRNQSAPQIRMDISQAFAHQDDDLAKHRVRIGTIVSYERKFQGKIAAMLQCKSYFMRLMLKKHNKARISLT